MKIEQPLERRQVEAEIVLERRDRALHDAAEFVLHVAPPAPVSKSRRLAIIRLADDFDEVGFRYRPRMGDVHRAHHLDGLGDVLLAHAEAFQAGRQAEADVEIEKTAGGIGNAERAFDTRHGVWSGGDC